MQRLNELPHLVRLLDDEDPTVRHHLEEHFNHCQGDLSRELSELGISLKSGDRDRLSRLLAPGRRRQIRKEWSIPSHGLDGIDGDWAALELLLRHLSEFLHDGCTVRPTLPDALDALSDEVVLHHAHHNERALCEYLFESGPFLPNKHGFYEPENADLGWILTHRRGNPIGLAAVAMLVAQRLDLHIAGCNFPAHFLAWITVDGRDHLVDCYNRGRLIAIDELRSNSSVLTPDARLAISRPCSLRDILGRMLGNLQLSFNQGGRTKDAELVAELLVSIET